MACHAAALPHQPPPPASSSSSPSHPFAARAPWRRASGPPAPHVRFRLTSPSPASARAARISPRCSYSAAGESPAKALRRVLETPGAHQAPACYDALSARLVQRAGFRVCFTSGFSISAARLGLPDVGLISYGEMIDQGRLITEATSIPVIGDADNGYGNSMNVKRTVKGFIKAGFAGIILEDQYSEGVTKSLWTYTRKEKEMKAFCTVSPGVPKMANMLEGGGKTPILSPAELEETGYKLIAYPLSLIGVSVRAMEDALVAIKGGRIPPPGSLPSFEEIKDTLGFNSYYEEEKRYVVTPAHSSSYRSSYYGSTNEANSQGDTKSRTEIPQEPVIDILPQLYDVGSTGGKGPSTGMWSRTLRLRITGRDGVQKIDARIPAGFLEGMTQIIPGLNGTNIMERLRNAPIDAENPQNGQILLDFENAIGDRIQVFIA
ncbi:hypothetical protein GUJ93_ZPchr0014g46938 [Zizania palustris]|uniref:Isocitrate lyase n=1 Tax=Zizania palustris TaxID=103762 RepID=A0A8J5SX99_ZIZPA|nr:hypothetical protein GUJ93_ZPchr0014g46938 [Zizania palustris]